MSALAEKRLFGASGGRQPAEGGMSLASAASRPPLASNGWRFALLLGLLGWVAFSHGCHGDEDDEPGVAPPSRRDERVVQQVEDVHVDGLQVGRQVHGE
jgi:hypothetical protein